MYRVEGKQCENEVDLAELQAALENSFTEHRYFLDLESGTVVLVTDETSRELEDVYVELPEEAESAQVVEAIRRRPLQDWQIEELPTKWKKVMIRVTSALSHAILMPTITIWKISHLHCTKRTTVRH